MMMVTLIRGLAKSGSIAFGNNNNKKTKVEL